MGTVHDSGAARRQRPTRLETTRLGKAETQTWRSYPSLASANTYQLVEELGLPESDPGFETDPLARFVLDFDAHILRANIVACALMEQGVIGWADVLLCQNHRDRPRLDIVLNAFASGESSEGRILVRGQDDRWGILDLYVCPALGEVAFASLRRPSNLSSTMVEPLQHAFGLTTTEQMVLTRLTMGDAPKEISRKLNVSTHTVRAHLRAIFMKMGVKGIGGALRLACQLSH